MTPGSLDVMFPQLPLHHADAANHRADRRIVVVLTCLMTAAMFGYNFGIYAQARALCSTIIHART